MNWLTQFAIPFLLSALVVIVITIAAERFGTKIGGIIGTLPTNMAVAFFFIAYNNGTDFASRAVAVVPAEMGVNILFLLIFSLTAFRSLPYALVVSLASWAGMSAVLVWLDPQSVLPSLALYGGMMLPAFLFLEVKKKVVSGTRVRVHYTPQKILLRGLFAGSVIALAVVLANVGAAISGIFSVFPAIFLSTMTIFVLEHGARFAGAMAKSMILGSLTVVGYATAIHYLYPSHGLVWGTLASYALAAGVVLVVSRVFRRMR
ncbi:MAG: hypothetical protein PHU95_02920 [Candidatus Thermoplasmatota archaeon]|nr:hypothetical protein [Candidatus Thermoplasmatota archaeon]MDD5778384.1 hypothetical protein [Candidatus Thermoplasmatota archaeon]